MSLFKWLSFELWYLRHPPWNTGIVPPELVEFIASHPPGCALDLGCGSGTSSLALARAGWAVCGVDYVAHAIRMARQKARLTGLVADFHVGDVTRLPPSIRATCYDLVLDIGCFHGLITREQDTYFDNLKNILASGGSWLVFGFFKPQENPLPGLPVAELGSGGKSLKLVWRRDGVNKKDRPSAWLCYRLE